VKEFISLLVRIVVITFIEALSLLFMSWIAPGINILPVGEIGTLEAAVSIAIVLALVNGLIRPLLILITMPINLLTVGVFTVFINAGLLWFVSWLLPYFEVTNFWAALLGALILAAVNTLITSLTTIDDDNSFYDGVVQWLSRRQMGKEGEQPQTRGLVMLEIDGLSYQRIQKAIEMGLMPTLKKMLESGTHRLSHIDCGLPSQTSACQAGIMYGDNHDIPAFRWYDKDEGRLYVSNNFTDAFELNLRYANGQGLLREGTSINNLMSGEADNTLMTMSTMKGSKLGDNPRTSKDLYLVFVNPYFFTRAIVLTVWDLLVEFYQGARQRLRNEFPRINRLEKGYPILRALTNVFLRDISTYTVILDIMRGSPAIYTTFVGYDEIAHHAGPDTTDALDSLRGFDKQLARILDVIEHKAPRPYDVFVLSDHGQSVGATFLQRYDMTLADLLEELVAGRGKVAEINATEDARGQTAVLLQEIENLQTISSVGRIQGAALNRTSKALGKRVQEEEISVPMDADVLALVSGNLANVYFPLRKGKITAPELETAYPGLLESLVAHPGIGLVIIHEAGKDGDEPWVLSKSGARNLRTGVIDKEDPLLPYGDPEFRAAQLLRLADFPHAGDLIVISTLYPDGQVAAFEELVGSHGGLGGQQTDAFLFHPADMDVPPTTNSADVYYLLNARRDLPGGPYKPEQEGGGTAVNPWAWETMKTGLRDWHLLLSRAARTLKLERSVFHDVAGDPYATGQALLLALLIAAGAGVALALDTAVAGNTVLKFGIGFTAELLGWFFVVLLAKVTGGVLHGRGSFTRTLRAMSFARVPGFLGWFSFIPVIGPVLRIISVIMVFLATWMALQEALRLSRWRALIIPIVAVILFFLAGFILLAVLSGLELTIDLILSQLGLMPAP
jgi:uncharacterized membrane protein YvlD (DUF360 family)